MPDKALSQLELAKALEVRSSLSCAASRPPVACVLLASTRELPKGWARAGSGRQAAAEAAKAEEVKMHVAGLWAKAAEVLRQRLLAKEQAAAEAAEKEESQKRQKKKRDKAQASQSLAAPLRSRLVMLCCVDISVRKIHVPARLADTSGSSVGCGL